MRGFLYSRLEQNYSATSEVSSCKVALLLAALLCVFSKSLSTRFANTRRTMIAATAAIAKMIRPQWKNPKPKYFWIVLLAWSNGFFVE